MATFDPATGGATFTTASGTRRWMPPFTSPEQIMDYLSDIQKVPSIKQATVLNIQKFDPSRDKFANQSTYPNLPAVQIWNSSSPSLFAVVYTDINGNSTFSYKNDPGNYVQLIKNGSQIMPVSQTQPATGKQGTEQAATGKQGTEQAAIGTQRIDQKATGVDSTTAVAVAGGSSLFLSMSSGFMCLILIIIGVVIYMKSRQT
jgi:hypothetical protein